jgi:hypothetical protein
VWYQLLLACAATTQCQTALDDQLPSIVQQLQDSGHGMKVFELARDVCNAQKCEAEAQVALSKAKQGMLGAQNKLQEELAADHQPIAYDSDLLRYLRQGLHSSHTDADEWAGLYGL